jgi:6-phosphogluconolactonase
MLMNSRRLAILAVASFVAAPGVGLATGRKDTEHREGHHRHRGAEGAVYTMTNASSGNQVIAYERRADGSLRHPRAYSTGGLGSDDGLGSQGAVVLSDDGRWLLVVNAGSNEVSVFSVTSHGLELKDTAPSRGTRPISVAIHGDLVYVLNAGGSTDTGDVDTIAGLRLRRNGRLSPLYGSRRALSQATTTPAQVGFSPDGRFVLVTEEATNIIDVFPLSRHGYARDVVANPSVGMTPFAFAFDPRGHLLVSEVFGAAPDAGAVSSYRLTGHGSLKVIDPSVPDTETAPCWLVVTPDGRYAFTTNTPADSVSGYSVDFRGRLELLDPDGRSGEPGTGTSPLDMDLTDDGHFLYTLDIGTHMISVFRVKGDGSLGLLPAIGDVPDGAVGLAAR